ncbi:carboxymuconolactone decarboxylase family protein [Maribacter sp. 2-571]|uniref:carboxymuconolactone decarboxylase family protein n=1 Tax=Maribacter sp. 2-571 TaxID=3417569 RepID=UPI003D335161
MSNFKVPTRAEVTTDNQAIFDHLEKAVGFVPNLFATYAYSESALKNYLDFSNAKTSLKAKEKEVVNLAVSQVNNCEYCLAAHTAIAKMNGFTDAEILELRSGKATFDTKLDALAKLSKNIVENRGSTDEVVLQGFFEAGWTKENLVDTISLVGDKTISNYLHKTTLVPIDFPAAPILEDTLV